MLPTSRASASETLPSRLNCSATWPHCSHSQLSLVGYAAAVRWGYTLHYNNRALGLHSPLSVTMVWCSVPCIVTAW